MTHPHVRLLLVDDEESVRKPLKRFLEDNFGYTVDALSSGRAALDQATRAQGAYDVALIDEVLVSADSDDAQGLDDWDGFETMEQIKARYRDIEVIIFTGWGTQAKTRALQRGAFRYLQKPFNFDELAVLIRTAAQQVRLREIGRAILSEHPCDQILEIVIAAANALSLADEATIVLRDPVTGKLSVHANTYPAERQWTRHFTERLLTREIVETGVPVWVPDTEQEGGLDPRVLSAGIRSFIGLPIPGERGNQGVVYVYSTRPGRFDDWGTLSVLQTLADQAGLALANLGAFDRIRAHADHMEALVRTTRKLTRTTSRADQLGLAWDFVREQLRTKTFFVGLYEAGTDTLSFPLFYDNNQIINIADAFLGDNPEAWGIAGWVVRHARNLYWRTSEERDQVCSAFGILPNIIGDPCQSCLFVPLIAGEQVIGVMSMQAYAPFAFDDSLRYAFEALASQLVVALRNSQLFDAEARRRREAETLYQSALMLTRATDQAQVFNSILHELQKVVPYDSASVQLLKGQNLEIIAGLGFPNPDEIIGLSFPIDGGNPNQEVVRRGVPFIVPDVQVRYEDFSKEPHVQGGIRAWLGAPMTTSDGFLGMIAIDKKEPDFFTEEHARLAQSFAALAAVAVEKAQLLDRVSRARDAARAVARITTLGKLDASLQSVAQGMMDVTGCDAVTLYAFNEMTGTLVHPPTMLGVRCPALAAGPDGVPSRSIVYRMLYREEPYVADDAPKDELLSKSRFTRDEEIKTCVVIPLHDATHQAGVMFVNYRSPHGFEESELAGLELLADQATVAIRNAQLFEAEQRHTEAFVAMHETAAAVSKGLDLDALLRMIAEKAAAIVGAPATSLMLWDRTDEYLEIRAAHGLSERYCCSQRIARATVERLAGLMGSGPLEFPIGDAALGDSRLVQEEGLLSVLVAPLVWNEQLIGALNTYSKQHRRFEKREKDWAEILANHASIAIGNAWLHDQQQQEVRRQVVANRAAREVGRTLDLHVVLQTLVDELATAIGVEQCALARFDEAQQYGTVIAEYLDPGCVSSIDEQIPLRNNPAVDHVRRTKDPLAVRDAQHDPIMKPVWDIMKKRRTQSIMLVPIVIGDEVIGTIGLDSVTRLRDFTEDEQRLAATIAHNAANAIHKAQIHAELETRYEQLREIQGFVGPRTVLDWMRMVSDSWHHSIKREIGISRWSIELVRKALGKGDRQQALEELAELEARLATITEIPIAAPLSLKDAVDLVRINALVKTYLSSFLENPNYAGAELEFDLQPDLDSLACVWASEGWLQRGLQIVAENALQAMLSNDRPVKRLTATTRLVGDHVQIRIGDTGPGVDDQTRGKLFKEPIGERPGSRGAGIGCMLASSIFGAYRGKIVLEETGPCGTTMVIDLPVQIGEPQPGQGPNAYGGIDAV
jgi:GAF domain-containing protein